MLFPNGSIYEISTFRNYSAMLLVKDNPEGYYEMTSYDGYVIILDQEGYLAEN
ncbi:MAG: hypothetical protein AB2L24_20015 [Mangrovibacterium sp.]